MAFVFTVETGTGLEDSNSYVSVSEADDYLVIKPNSTAWAALITATKEKYLAWATRLLDQRAKWAGTKAVADSALAWPRLYVFDREKLPVPIDVVPDEVKAATVEIAYHLFSQSADPSSPASAGATGVKRYKLDVLEIEYQDNAASSSNPFPLGLNKILMPLGSLAASGPNFVPITRV